MTRIKILTFRFKIATDFIKLSIAIKIQISLWEIKSRKNREINQKEILLHPYREKAQKG